VRTFQCNSEPEQGTTSMPNTVGNETSYNLFVNAEENRGKVVKLYRKCR